jgi:diguanylate cyclase (GGDEF)-like protein
LRLVIMAAALALWLALALLTRSIAVTLQRSETAHRHLALYDPMTGLPNRHHFTAIATRVGEELGPLDQPAAIVLLDLTAFSQINNALGRAHGDELLVHVSGRLRSMLQPGQVVARLGGDVFGLLLPGVDSPTALSLLPLVHDVLGAELDVAGIPVSFEAAVGVASFPVDGEDMATVLQRADLALEAAKTGHAGAVAYSPQLDRTDPSQLGLAVELRRAMANGELFLVYQPKVHLADLTLRSAEALLRWNHPVRGPIPPSMFVPVAESTGLIVPLTAWVVEQAVQQASRWYGQGLPLRVAVNVSARNLRDERLPDQVLRSLARHQLPPELIELEITETAVLADPDGAARAVRRMRDAGVAVALDDFGQGATSLRHLRNLPLTTLKIDKCFVDNVCGDPIDAAIVYATIGLGHQLGMEVVAEGVETEQQYAALAAWGCDVAQGYYFERPLTVQQLNARFVAGAPDAPAAPHGGSPTEFVGADSQSAAMSAAPMPMAPIEGVDVYR